jgi:hypothetical protein
VYFRDFEAFLVSFHPDQGRKDFLHVESHAISP